ncbi:MAG: hypothetical protein P0S93_03320 [Candidatus Neptunochlamydia sp.]|nr:hypothetical protein [Candidatus Neptunochlamydia sp.]
MMEDLCATRWIYNESYGAMMELPGVNSNSSRNTPEIQKSAEKEGGDPCKIYEMEQVREFASFVSNNKLSVKTKITSQEFQEADRMEGGVSGAMKLRYEGHLKIIKPQVLTKVFSENLKALTSSGKHISHANVSESDDSFAHFPRKELLGWHIARIFALDVPDTELVEIETELGESKYASAQIFLTDAVSMINTKVEPYKIDLNSVILTFLFHLFTENIDGHTGNILLIPYEGEDDEEDLVEYKVIPIDYGLIYPRHDSIYPKEFSLLKKGFFHSFKTKKIHIHRYLKPLVEKLENALNAEFCNLMTSQEKQLYHRNLTGLQRILGGEESSLSLNGFLDTFVAHLMMELKDEH